MMIAKVLSLSSLPALLMFQAVTNCNYGQSAYGGAAYNGSCTVSSLADTGSTWLAIAGAAIFAIGVGLFFWFRRRQKRKRQVTA